MRTSVSYNGYNRRRYGRPWIAKVVEWPIGGQPKVVWGSYLGDDDGGECEIDAQVGDVIRTGQKDNRGNNSCNEWFIVSAPGILSTTDAKGAREAWMANASKQLKSNVDLSTVSDADLLAEVIRRGLK